MLIEMIKNSLENIDRDYVKLSKTVHLNENRGYDPFQERPLAYEFYHQFRILSENNPLFIESIQAEVNKTYQNYFESGGKIPDFIIHIPNTNKHNLAVLEFKRAAENEEKFRKDLNKLFEFKVNPELMYRHAIEVIFGDESDIRRKKELIYRNTVEVIGANQKKHLSRKSVDSSIEYKEITVIWLNTYSWDIEENKILWNWKNKLL